ncbi:hypothetical protein TRIP_E100129 [uncultured Spirochaetota bacterium]|uniref:Uncharacterized protein n=1 Tax=uncultured Spirochaetota bacterium TaxID=460511 RepID=A0A652ZRX4_9SPIR|nr:hypothetical protein TRIP_E100129 [uncultured Spirochaetota bacterium]
MPGREWVYENGPAGTFVRERSGNMALAAWKGGFWYEKSGVQSLVPRIGAAAALSLF